MRLLFVHRERLKREAIAHFLGESASSPSIRAFDTIESAASALAPGDIDVVVMDATVPAKRAHPSLKAARALCPAAPVVILSGAITRPEAEALIAAGATGIVSTSIAATDLWPAILARIGGKPFILGEFPARRAEPAFQPAEPFSRREAEVARLLLAGRQNKEIGAELGLAEITARLHVRQVLRKLGARNRSDAVRIMLTGSHPGDGSD